MSRAIRCKRFGTYDACRLLELVRRAEETGDVERLVDFLTASETPGCERFSAFVLAGNWEPCVMGSLEEAFEGRRPRTLAAFLVGFVDEWGDEHVLVEFRSRSMNWDVEAA